MCGIVGQVRADGRPVDPLMLERMCAAVQHRGPDSRGTFCEAGAGLGIQRLRVIDLATGDQPIYNEDRSVAVVLNGEIYNFQELRERLGRAGHTFSTRGDTEVIAHLYEDEGESCVHHLHGMFAFALWDARRRKLLLARDRIGKKPVLYAMRDGALSFASEMAALLEDPEVPREIDPIALDAYLALQYVPVPMSAFRAVRKLPPATMLIWEDGETRLERYWRITYRPKRESTDPRVVSEALREQLERAVRRRMIADVPLGAFLSGGVDSSAVVAAMARSSSEPVKTFSIGFEDEAHSELPRARLVAERYGTDHHEFVIKPDALSLIPAIVRHYGEPFADTSSVPSFQVSQIASRYVTVALNGDGGDESFAGYHRYRAGLRIERLARLPRPVRRAIAVAGALTPERVLPRELTSSARRLARQLGMSPVQRHEFQVGYFGEEERAALYSDEFRTQVGRSMASDAIEAAWERASGFDLLDKLLEVDVNTYLPDDLCVKIDIATMAYSLEARSPFLDHELMAFAAALPADMKLRGTETKIALREALRDWLPSEILDGPKMGFGMPVVTDWFRGDLRGLIGEVLLDPATLRRGYFREQSIRRLIDEHASGARDHGNRLWALMMFELWHREFADGATTEAPDALPGAAEPAP